MNADIQAALADLRAKVEADRNVETAAVTAFSGLAQQLKDALASKQDPAEVVGAIQDIATTLDRQARDFAAAIPANTPAALPVSGNVTTTTADAEGSPR